MELAREELDVYAYLKRRTEQDLDVLWHYGTWNTLSGIVNDNVIWASNALYLNDSSELRLADETIVPLVSNCPHEYLKQTFDERRRAGLASYVSCLTSAFDDLSQWRGYAQTGPSFAIGFNSELLTQRARAFGFERRPCEYDRGAFETTIRAILAQLDPAYRALDRTQGENDGVQLPEFNGTPRFKVHQGYLQNQVERVLEIEIAAAQRKHPSFWGEKETRLISDKYAAERGHLKRAMHVRGSLPVPHVEIPLGQQHEYDTKGTVIAAVLVGPVPHPDLTVAAVKMLVSGLEPKVHVAHSQVPFRNW